MPDGRTQRLQAESDHWYSIAGKPDLEVAERIRKDQIDILVDLEGHTGENRLLVFAHKPAPVQVTWLGYPNTTGMRTIDYRLTDAVADPPGEADKFHSEKLFRLEHGFLCYLPDAAAPEAGPPPCLESGQLTFGSFNNLAKVTSEVVRVWAEILHRQPLSRLVLKSKPLADQACRERYLGLFAEQGIPADRLELLGWLPAPQNHLELYHRIDIGLDSFPYNGTTTTCEALWMGVPVVTLCGDRHAARVGASIMRQVGLEELVAHSEDEYIALAVALAQDRQRLLALRGSQRRKMRESRLLDKKLFAETLEDAYRRMWEEWCAEVN
jgi:predicted O-linked N-acetylglucosamine transferase (SPINDLY family)